MLTKARDEPEKGMIQKVFHAYKEDTMRNKKNRVKQEQGKSSSPA